MYVYTSLVIVDYSTKDYTYMNRDMNLTFQIKCTSINLFRVSNYILYKLSFSTIT